VDAFLAWIQNGFLAWIENGELSNWIRGSESIFAFPAIITLHTIGMGFLAGTSTAIDLRVLGFAPRVPLKPLDRFFPLMWLALAVNVMTGVLLVIAYPTKALTNPLFYLKLALVVLALILVRWIDLAVLRRPDADHKPIRITGKLLAFTSIVTWIAVITAGRLLAYTNRWELLGIPAIH
jgi:uncharacterized protein DUF6644